LNNKLLGDFGEDIAANYLVSQGYTIRKQKYKVKIGEIDIIATHKNSLIFIEVKTRRNITYGYPAQAVNQHKQFKIIQTAQCYLTQTNQYDKICRFDVIEIYYNSETNYNINHIKNAFEF
jgi:putative endonuclease